MRKSNLSLPTLIATLCLGLILNGCAFSSNDSIDNSKEVEDNARLNKLYSGVQGLYEGTLTGASNPNKTQKVELSLLTLKVPAQTNRQGTIIRRITLFAKFRNLDTVESTGDVLLTATYDEVTGIISVSNDNGTFAIEGRIANQTLSGNLIRNGGVVGSLNLPYKSAVATTPIEGTDQETRDRLYNMYLPLAGYYNGFITPPTTPDKSFKVKIGIYIVEVQIGVNQNGQTKFVPSLRARYQRWSAENQDTMTEDILMLGQYEPLNNEIILRSADIKNSTSITALIKDNQLIGLSSNKMRGVKKDNGLIGDIVTTLDPAAGIPQSPDDRVTDADDLRNMEILRILYEPLEGLYSGTVTSLTDPNVKFNAEIALIMQKIPSGLTPEGKQIMKYFLKAKYRDLTATTDVFMDVGYYQDTQSIYMATTASSPAAGSASPTSPGEVVSIDGLIRDKVIDGKTVKVVTGNIIRNGGVLGKAELIWQSKVPPSYTYGSEQETRKRLLEMYQPLTGNYNGTVTSPDGKTTFKFKLGLSINENGAGANSQGEKVYMPALQVRFQRLANDIIISDQNMSVKYYTNSQVFVMSTTSGTSLTINAKLSNKKLLGSMTSGQGLMGSLVAEYDVNNTTPTAPIDNPTLEQRRILTAIYKSVAGVYRGIEVARRGNNNNSTTGASLKIYLVEGVDSTGLVLPTLKAQYFADDQRDASISRFMNVVYYPENNTIACVVAAANSSNVPGGGFFSMNGSFDARNISLTMQDHMGFYGTFKGKWTAPTE